MIKALISYYRSCYQRDYRAISLLNFLGSKVTDRIFIEDIDVLTGKITPYPISTDWAEQVEKELLIYSKEKELYCAAFFILGKVSIGGKNIEMTAPLYLYPTDLLKEQNVYYISIDAENPIINPAISYLVEDTSTGLMELLNQALPKSYFNFEKSYQLEQALQNLLPNLEISNIDHFSKFFNLKEIEAFRTKAAKRFELIPACGLGLLKKSTGSRGVLNELEMMINEHKFSIPLKEIFIKTNVNAKEYKYNLSVPVILSENQTAIIKTAMTQHLSLVIGPPGTGKSYTIAALAIEFLSQGKTVLIASKNNQAGKVIAQKIEQDFELKGLIVHAAQKDYKKELQKRLNNWLNGIGIKQPNIATLKALKQKIERKSKEIANLEKEILDEFNSERGRGILLQNIYKKYILIRCSIFKFFPINFYINAQKNIPFPIYFISRSCGLFLY